MKEIIVPAITANEDEIKLSKLFVKENEYCKKNDIICSFESSKTSVDLNALTDGFVLIFVKEGKNVKIGEVIGLISSDKISKEIIKKDENKSEELAITKKAEILIKKHKLNPREIKRIGVISSEDVQSFINKKIFTSSLNNEDKEYLELEKIMKSFNYKNASIKDIAKLKDTLSLAQKIYQKKWQRFIPPIDTIYDRWSSAERSGFGEGSNVSQLSYIIGKVKVGKNCFIGPFTVLDGSAGISIGDGTSIAAGVHIYSHDTVSRSLGGKNAFKNANRFLIDLTEVTFTDYEGCDIDTSSIKFNSFELIALESSFNITIEGLHPSYAYASRYVILEEDL